MLARVGSWLLARIGAWLSGAGERLLTGAGQRLLLEFRVLMPSLENALSLSARHSVLFGGKCSIAWLQEATWLELGRDCRLELGHGASISNWQRSCWLALEPSRELAGAGLRLLARAGLALEPGSELAGAEPLLLARAGQWLPAGQRLSAGSGERGCRLDPSSTTMSLQVNRLILKLNFAIVSEMLKGFEMRMRKTLGTFGSTPTLEHPTQQLLMETWTWRDGTVFRVLESYINRIESLKQTHYRDLPKTRLDLKIPFWKSIADDEDISSEIELIEVGYKF
ncbi:hypothetical protein L1887_14757 [Cichorium endivia]|nr:hypothetical protein L1887_14757 [Cichorium endivia]